MNIVTFCTPVSVAPPKLWIVSFYTNTKTRQEFLEQKVGVLQLLTPTMQSVVPVLGKRSGYEQGYSKRDECHKLGHTWIHANKQWLAVDSDIPTQNEVRYVVHFRRCRDMFAVAKNHYYDIVSTIRKLMLPLYLNDTVFRDELPTMELLPKCAVYIGLKLLSTSEAGDHDVALCQVVETGIWDETTRRIVSTKVCPAALDPTTALYTAQLRAEGII